MRDKSSSSPEIQASKPFDLDSAWKKFVERYKARPANWYVRPDINRQYNNIKNPDILPQNASKDTLAQREKNAARLYRIAFKAGGAKAYLQEKKISDVKGAQTEANLVLRDVCLASSDESRDKLPDENAADARNPAKQIKKVKTEKRECNHIIIDALIAQWCTLMQEHGALGKKLNNQNENSLLSNDTAQEGRHTIRNNRKAVLATPEGVLLSSLILALTHNVIISSMEPFIKRYGSRIGDNDIESAFYDQAISALFTYDNTRKKEETASFSGHVRHALSHLQKTLLASERQYKSKNITLDATDGSGDELSFFDMLASTREASPTSFIDRLEAKRISSVLLNAPQLTAKERDVLNSLYGGDNTEFRGEPAGINSGDSNVSKLKTAGLRALRKAIEKGTLQIPDGDIEPPPAPLSTPSNKPARPPVTDIIPFGGTLKEQRNYLREKMAECFKSQNPNAFIVRRIASRLKLNNYEVENLICKSDRPLDRNIVNLTTKQKIIDYFSQPKENPLRSAQEIKYFERIFDAMIASLEKCETMQGSKTERVSHDKINCDHGGRSR